MLVESQMNNDTIDWLDLDLWPEKKAHKAADMDNSYAWSAQQSQALSGQSLHDAGYQLQSQVLQPPDGILFHDTFNPQSTAGSLLSELSGVRKHLPNCVLILSYLQYLDDQEQVCCATAGLFGRSS